MSSNAYNLNLAHLNLVHQYYIQIIDNYYLYHNYENDLITVGNHYHYYKCINSYTKCVVIIFNF